MTPGRSTRGVNALAVLRSSMSTRAGTKDLKEERQPRARRAAGHVDPGSVRFRIRSGVDKDQRPPQGRVRAGAMFVFAGTRRSPAISNADNLIMPR